MKHTLTALAAILGFLALSLPAHAENVRLSYKSSPLPPLAGGTTETLKVYDGGEVVLESCRAIYPNPCQSQTVDYLGRYQLRKMERQIRLAAKGQIVDPNPFEIRCKALPTHHIHFAADNEDTLLLEGNSPCGGMTRNTSKAAQELVQFLRELRAMAYDS